MFFRIVVYYPKWLRFWFFPNCKHEMLQINELIFLGGWNMTGCDNYGFYSFCFHFGDISLLTLKINFEEFFPHLSRLMICIFSFEKIFLATIIHIFYEILIIINHCWQSKVLNSLWCTKFYEIKNKSMGTLEFLLDTK